MPLALIVSVSFDEPTWGPIRAQLMHAGLDVVVFEADRIASGDVAFTYSLRGASASIELAGQALDLKDVHAAWWRKPHWLRVHRADLLRARSLEHEVNRVQQALWAPIRPAVWLNDPNQMRVAGSLSRQFMAAEAASLATPTTIITNDWGQLRAFGAGQPLAYKALVGHVETEGEPGRNVFTRRLKPTDISALEDASLPYPGIAQHFFEKEREWRITVVGEHVFSVAIYSRGRARVDWRHEQRTPNVRLVADDVPLEVATQCRAVTSGLGLRYAAIDLIEQPNGGFIFLEANPNGQYLWLEDELGLPISEAIANTLIAIAQGQAGSA